MKVYDIAGHIRNTLYPCFGSQARISDLPLLFMHIPKTSGMALNSAFREALAPRRALLLGYDRVVFGSFQSFDSMDPELRSRIYLDPADLPASLDFTRGHISFSTLLKSY